MQQKAKILQAVSQEAPYNTIQWKKRKDFEAKSSCKRILNHEKTVSYYFSMFKQIVISVYFC